MSRMADLYIEVAENATNYLTRFGIDEDLIWDAANVDHNRVIELARLHKEANGRITNVTEQALRALLIVNRHANEVVIS